MTCTWPSSSSAPASSSFASFNAGYETSSKDGKVLVTDGPFAETKEHLGGLLVLEAGDMNQAVELMSKPPGVRLGGPFEIRPVEEIPEVQPRIGRK